MWKRHPVDLLSTSLNVSEYTTKVGSYESQINSMNVVICVGGLTRKSIFLVKIVS